MHGDENCKHCQDQFLCTNFGSSWTIMVLLIQLSLGERVNIDRDMGVYSEIEQ